MTDRSATKTGSTSVRDINHMIRFIADPGIALGSDGDEAALTGADFFNVAHNLVVDPILRGNKHHRHILIDQRDRTVFHLHRRIGLTPALSGGAETIRVRGTGGPR